MPMIQRRRPHSGADQWSWPADTHPVLKQVWARRPISSPEELDLALAGLLPVGEFGALAAAVDLLQRYRERRIVIVGDFDADGATSTALMVLGLRALGFAEIDYFVPDRFTLGYGLSAALVERLLARAPALIVTVDNGISSHAGVAAAHAHGIEVLITDHHLPAAELPPAAAIVNPNVPGEAFGGKNLAGVGVAFYLLAALARQVDPGLRVSDYLDIVALGTVADLVPLDRTNRILVRQGLKRIRAGRTRPGILALCELAGVEPREIAESALGFQLAPRLNAAGRLDDMSLGIQCLLTDDPEQAARLAGQLDGLNRARRDIEQRMKLEAAALVDDLALDADAPGVVCLYRNDWHEGLVGLVASRIKDRCHRPTIAFAPADGGRLKGSARSVPGFHLRDALAEVDALQPGLIERFGGHAMAAGLTLRSEALDTFRQLMQAVGERHLTPELLAREIHTDGELAAADCTLPVAALLRDAGPWGQGFPEPRFDGSFELLDCRVLKDRHTQMKLRPVGAQAALSAIAFNQCNPDWYPGQQLHVVYRLTVNEYGGRQQLQLVVEYSEPGHTGP